MLIFLIYSIIVLNKNREMLSESIQNTFIMFDYLLLVILVNKF